MDPNEGQDELEEVQAELKKKEAEVSSMACPKKLTAMSQEMFATYHYF